MTTEILIPKAVPVRESGWLYYVDTQGNLVRTRMAEEE